MSIKKLIVREFIVDEGDKDRQLEIGERYTYFQDPDTGKFYQPVEGFTVIAEDSGDLSDRFIEVKT